jgi:uracil phosphoribosyltransferase
MDYEGSKLVERAAMIPILRSGLGMVDSMLELLPNAAIHHIGMYHVQGQNPVLYYNKLPKKHITDVAYILDPVIATSATVLSAISLLKKVRASG